MNEATIIPIVYAQVKGLLLHISKCQDKHIEIYKSLIEIVLIIEDKHCLFKEDNRIIALLRSIYDYSNIPPGIDNTINYIAQEESFKFCCYCIDRLTSLPNFVEFEYAKELSFSIARFHNRNIQSEDLCQKYISLVQNHSVLMTDAVLFYMQLRYTTHNIFARFDETLLSAIFLNIRYVYYDLLPWFLNQTSWSKFQLLLYGKCAECDVSQKYYYNPENYMNSTLRALNKKDNGHNTMKMLRILLRGLDYDEFMSNYFVKFTQNYNACTCEDVSTSYNYNLVHYVLPAIILSYPTKVIYILEALCDGQSFFEDLFLVVLIIASRNKLLNLNWCLNNHVYHHLQVCQAWIAAKTLNVIINVIADSNNIVICFKLLERFMIGATYDRLRSVYLLDILKKLIMHAVKITRQKKKDRLQDVNNFATFLLNFTKTRFKESEASHKQYYFEIFQETRQNLPYFFHEIPKQHIDKSFQSKICSTKSVLYFLHTLKSSYDTNLCVVEIDCYLETLLRYKHFHDLEHCLMLEITKYYHSLTNSVPGEILALSLAVYRKLIETRNRCIKADILERIVLEIIPKQTESDPNIFINMNAALEQAVIESVRIIYKIINCNLDQCVNKNRDYEYSALDFLRLCEHILEYAPSKKLVFEISRLHRAALKEQAGRDANVFLSYAMETIYLLTGTSILVSRRTMRRHPSITEIIRNILIVTLAYESRTGQIFHTKLQNELLNYVKSTKTKDDLYFVLATEAQKVFFDTKEFAFKNVIRADELIMHILNCLDIVLKWETITALIQLLQAIWSAFLSCGDSLLFRRYFNLITDILTFMPSRTITIVASLYVLHVLNFRDMPRYMRNKLPKFKYTETRNCNKFAKVLYECTIYGQMSPSEAIINLTSDIDKLEGYSDETCHAILALIENLYTHFFRN